MYNPLHSYLNQLNQQFMPTIEDVSKGHEENTVNNDSKKSTILFFGYGGTLERWNNMHAQDIEHEVLSTTIHNSQVKSKEIEN